MNSPKILNRLLTTKMAEELGDINRKSKPRKRYAEPMVGIIDKLERWLDVN